MKNIKKTGRKENLSSASVFVIHVLIGISLFYFIIHPLTMVIYWFEFNDIKLSMESFTAVFRIRFLDSFKMEMIGMASMLSIIGALFGCISGLYYLRIREKKNLILKQGDQLKREVEILINKGETDQVEFKSSLRFDYVKTDCNKDLEFVFIKTIAGFLNANGGKLLIGVADDRSILGLNNDFKYLRKKNCDGFELKIYQLISNFIGTEFCSLVHTSFHKIDQKEICLVDIEESNIPAFVNYKNNVTYFLRAGNSTRPLSVKEAVYYINIGKS